MLSDAQLIYQGAEARVYRTPFLGRTAVVKERFSKAYRHPTLDHKLTSRRVVQEARLLQRCRRAGVDVPAVYYVDQERSTIYMEHIDATTVRDYLRQNTGLAADEVSALADIIGGQLAKMHAADVVHGDLTTSNMMLSKQEPFKITLIDFGLSYTSTLAEDKAVDLYVLERAFLSTHPNSEAMFQRILDAYGTASGRQHAKQVLHKLDEVRLRGRKRSMLG
ncbi:kinase-like domain-containing protein [Syncephalis pseudoplumigaleata]|uniref:non-specific serine/threonine protein kinase n=1 Tax=Syncephalis pseudoplumigaleata TaxID=1712513 RepID=A0A4P9Z1Y4_9FUNG|nr:kinase-like domain-containing protein [Syncephalis pseudoplumigaleata]|eukprot:RKP26517.1 kinase-like domain-containing protein [Syncephalis pseudoplumigaleata]